MEFDAVTLEAPEHVADITQYPVEAGATLTDHIRVMPTVFRMTVVVSNTPARDDGLTHLDGAQAVRNMEIKVRRPLIPAPTALQAPTSFAGIPLSYDATVRASIRTWSPEIRRVTNIYAELLTAMSEARQFTIATDIGDFDGMVLKSIRPRRDAATARAPRFELEFLEIKTATLFQRDVSALLPKTKRSNPPANVGKVQAPEATPDATNKGTILYDLLLN